MTLAERPGLRRGSTALVTGGAQRIGRAIALALADCGMNVVVHYNRSRTQAHDLAAQIRKKGVLSWAIRGDFNRKNGCETLIKKASFAAKNSLSVLVNNASIYPSCSLDSMTLDDLELCVRINAWTPIALSRSFAKTVRRGCIVNLLDNRISGSARGHAAYLLSKQMLASATRLCALELAPRFRVNGVAPGLILPPAGKTGAYLDKLKHGVPLRMHGSPADVALAVVFCVTSPFLTGEIISVDGGKNLV
jgi:pteridine reductase